MERGVECKRTVGDFVAEVSIFDFEAGVIEWRERGVEP